LKSHPSVHAVVDHDADMMPTLLSRRPEPDVLHAWNKDALWRCKKHD